MKSFSRPNVLLLYTDQQRFDSLGCNGNALAHTPHLDALACGGARFSHFFVQHPACMPSRMSFLTGRYPASLGVGCNGVPFPAADATPLHRYLQPFGYHAAQIGKLHFAPHAGRDAREPYPDYGFDTAIIADNLAGKDNPYTQWIEAVAPEQLAAVRRSVDPQNSLLAQKYGLEKWLQNSFWFHNTFKADEGLTQSSWVASEMSDFLRRQKSPFFAVAGFFGPHAPISPPRRFLDFYPRDKMRLPILSAEEAMTPALQLLTDDDWREIAAHYGALVSHIDDCIGQILAALDESGQRENTLILFTSDHGESLGDHGRVAKGMPGHDCVVKVPFLMSFPRGIAPQTEVDELVEAVDVVPTLLDFCGVPTPRVVQGKSFKGLLEGSVSHHRDDVFIEGFAPFGPRQATVRTKTHKYCLGKAGEEILFDLAKDPDEGRNVAAHADYREILGEMRKRLLVRMQSATFNSRTQTGAF